MVILQLTSFCLTRIYKLNNPDIILFRTDSVDTCIPNELNVTTAIVLAPTDGDLLLALALFAK